MLDLKFIRENPDAVKRAIQVKHLDLDLDELLRVDAELVALKQKLEALQAERNQNAKLVPKAGADERPALIQRGKDLAEDIKAMEPELRAHEDMLRNLLLLVPQVPDERAPLGATDADNVEVRREGSPLEFTFTPRDHVELLEMHGWADLERVAKVSGSRSYLLKGDLVRLEQAIVTFALDYLESQGLTLLSTTALVRPDALVGTGHFPGGEDQVYKIDGEELMLAGTAEVPVNSLYAGEILPFEELPLAFAAVSGAFRSEAGSAGRDVRGLMRVHEFKKVEQYVMCRAEDAWAWFERILANAEGILRALELPYRVMANSTGDMGRGKVLMYDIEAWVPSEGRYRETHSCSYLGDWQARRTNLRYRDEQGKVRYAHTLNNTGIAVPRILVPFLENHQQDDGRVRIPEALRPYMRGREFIG